VHFATGTIPPPVAVPVAFHPGASSQAPPRPTNTQPQSTPYIHSIPATYAPNVSTPSIPTHLQGYLPQPRNSPHPTAVPTGVSSATQTPVESSQPQPPRQRQEPSLPRVSQTPSAPLPQQNGQPHDAQRKAFEQQLHPPTKPAQLPSQPQQQPHQQPPQQSQQQSQQHPQQQSQQPPQQQSTGTRPQPPMSKDEFIRAFQQANQVRIVLYLMMNNVN